LFIKSRQAKDMVFSMQIRNLYRSASLVDAVDLSTKERKTFFRPHPIKIGTPFDPYEKKTLSGISSNFYNTKRSSYFFYSRPNYN